MQKFIFNKYFQHVNTKLLLHSNVKNSTFQIFKFPYRYILLVIIKKGKVKTLTKEDIISKGFKKKDEQIMLE